MLHSNAVDVSCARPRAAAAVCVTLLAVAWPLIAAELRTDTVAAFDASQAEVEAAFVARPALDWSAVPARSGVLRAGPGRGDGISKVPGGLVHHWRGVAFVHGAALSPPYSSHALDRSTARFHFR